MNFDMIIAQADAKPAAPAGNGDTAPKAPATDGNQKVTTAKTVQPPKGKNAASPDKPAGSPYNMIIMVAIMGAIMYFMLIRPQKRKQKEHENMLSKVKAGDRVVTAGGIYGVVQNVKKDSVVLKVDDKAKLEMATGSITRVVKDEDEADKKDEDKK